MNIKSTVNGALIGGLLLKAAMFDTDALAILPDPGVWPGIEVQTHGGDDGGEAEYEAWRFLYGEPLLSGVARNGWGSPVETSGIRLQAASMAVAMDSGTPFVCVTPIELLSEIVLSISAHLPKPA